MLQAVDRCSAAEKRFITMAAGGLDQNARLADRYAAGGMNDVQRPQPEFLDDLRGKAAELGHRHGLVDFVVQCLQGTVFGMHLRPGGAAEGACSAIGAAGGTDGQLDRGLVKFDPDAFSHRVPAYTPHVLEPAVPISVFDLPPRPGLALANRLGFRAVTLSAAQAGLRPRELDRSARRGLLAELHRLELECTGIELFLPREHYEQSEHIDRALAAANQAITLADDLGALSIFLRLPPAGDDGAGSEAIRELANAAAGARVRVSDVSLDGQALVSVRKGEELPIDVGMDTAAWIAEGSDPIAGIVELDKRLGGIRLVDLDANGMRVPASAGRGLDLGAVRTGLEIGGFTGSVVLDARGWSDPINGLMNDLKAWRALRPPQG